LRRKPGLHLDDVGEGKGWIWEEDKRCLKKVGKGGGGRNGQEDEKEIRGHRMLTISGGEVRGKDRSENGIKGS